MLSDSKTHSQVLYDRLPGYDIRLGKAWAQAYVNDPRMLGFILARYKFVAKMLTDRDLVLEVGCGHGFGSVVVAHEVSELVCTDINADVIADSKKRWYPKNIRFVDHDFGHKPDLNDYDAAYLIDVIEHVYPSEEAAFMGNIVKSLHDDGVLIVGTPNVTAAPHASEYSRFGHVNLKSHDNLRGLMQAYFRNVFMFGMNDEVIHTGYPAMAHYLWAMGVGRR